MQIFFFFSSLDCANLKSHYTFAQSSRCFFSAVLFAAELVAVVADVQVELLPVEDCSI